MRTVPISSVADIIRGVTFGQSEVSTPEDEDALPVIRAMNILEDGKLSFDDLLYVDSARINNRQKIRQGDVVIAASTGSKKVIGKAAQATSDWKGGFGGFCMVLRPTDEINSKYFGYFFQTKAYRQQISHMSSGANINNLKKRHFDELKIAIPSAEDQKRIVSLLDQADALRRKRKESIKLLDEYVQSVFMEMFGDPVTNPKSWQEKKLSDVLEKIESGWSPKCSDVPASENNWGVLKLSAVTSCNYKDQQNKGLLASDQPRSLIEVKDGDLLFSRKNTYDLVAASCYVFETRHKLMLSDLIFRLVLKKNEVLPIFLWKVLSHHGKRKKIQALAGGSAGSMPNISKEKLRTAKIFIPPITLQKKFEEIVLNTRALEKTMLIQSIELDNQFNTLMQKAFAGSL
ncbi:MAG: restriction endonuclease subunit S [Rhabdochlamydiaceae bacterium]|nr:restriction endonuclease subunit S [Rhabdochlamydiaceae bacterium]MBP9773107.1 restriction endonuclease subunit S [Candidatus Peribacteraceae bacterium]